MSRLFELCKKDTKCVHDCKLGGVSWSHDNMLHVRHGRPTSVNGKWHGDRGQDGVYLGSIL